MGVLERQRCNQTRLGMSTIVTPDTGSIHKPPQFNDPQEGSLGVTPDQVVVCKQA